VLLAVAAAVGPHSAAGGGLSGVGGVGAARAAAAPPPPGRCEYAAGRATAPGETTCSQFPDGGVLTTDSTAPAAAGAFGVDVRAMTYSVPPVRDFTKFRRIVACSMAVGWASESCGQNVTCGVGRLAQIEPFWKKAAARKCDIALLPEDFFGYTTQPVQVYIEALAPFARKHGMYVAAGGHVIPAGYNESVYHKVSDGECSNGRFGLTVAATLTAGRCCKQPETRSASTRRSWWIGRESTWASTTSSSRWACQATDGLGVVARRFLISTSGASPCSRAST
jgi:hypothetical protein